MGWLLMLAFWFAAYRVGGAVARRLRDDPYTDAVEAVALGIIAGLCWPLVVIVYALHNAWLGGRS